MRKSVLAAAISAGASLSSLCTAAAGTLIPVPLIPDAEYQFAYGVNDSTVIAGDYRHELANGLYDWTGYVGTLDGQYTTFDYQDSSYSETTQAIGINNDGYIVGTVAGDDVCIQAQLIGCAFVRSPDGTIATVTRDGSSIDGIARGITKNVKFVGAYWYFDEHNHTRANGYLGKGSTYRADITLPFNTDRTHPNAINRHGAVAGDFRDLDNNGRYRGFVLQDGIVTAIDYPDPNAYSSYLDGMNDKGIIAGEWWDAQASYDRAFLFDAETGQFKAIEISGATYVDVGSINNAGLVALNVSYDPDGYSYIPYIYCSKKKACPQSPNAIEIPDKWVKAPAGSVRSIVCAHGCIGPWHGANAVSKVDRAAIRNAMRHDRALRLEMRPGLGR